MPFVPAICTQCGAQIEVDDTHEAGICQHCGTAFITEKAINNYTTNITNNIVNNNNFSGANVTIQNNANIDGLLLLAKRELQAKYYCSNDLDKYLEEIIIRSPEEGKKQIVELFHETGLYEIAETFVKQKGDMEEEWGGISPLLIRYDPENIIGWLMDWNESSFSLYGKDESGKNIIRLASESEKAMYEKEVYSYFVEEGPTCDAYKQFLGVIPLSYIEENKYIQDLLIERVNRLWEYEEQERRARIEYIKSLLPRNRQDEIKIVPSPPVKASSGGCYIATCVYGSYDCPQVWTLRRFRDYTLDKTWYGRAFIKCYYAVSPALVKWFGSQGWFRTFWKRHLDIMVSCLNRKGIENTSYTDKY